MRLIWEFLWPGSLYPYPGRWHYRWDQYCPGLQDSLGGLVDRCLPGSGHVHVTRSHADRSLGRRAQRVLMYSIDRTVEIEVGVTRL
jgi:hypothetical protein